jgi:anti-sigma regulatory factor (Ser/Thr protein kinase)
MQLNLVLEELFTNIVFYGFADDPAQERRIGIDFSRADGVLIVVVTDDAKPFNLLEQAEDPGVDKPLEERDIGGLGIHFVKTVMDSVEYARRDGKNIVTLTKKY